MFLLLKKQNNAKKLGLLLVVVFLVFIFSTSIAHAQFFQFAWDKIVGGVNTMLYNVLLIPLALALAGVATMANNMMLMTPIVTSPMVQIGWQVTRDFANMFFILILLGIALDFILFNSFGVKRALPKLLLVALLINFSLPLAGILIDFSHVFANFFMQQIAAGKGFTETIAQNLNMVNILEASGRLTDIESAQDGITQNILFSIVFMAGTVAVFFAIGIMFFIRTLYLAVLLIILPIILVLWAFPPTSSYFGKWGNKFIQWTMFAPIATFFLYLALLILGTSTTALPNINQTITEQIFIYVTAWALLLMAIVAGQSMGAPMGKMIMGIPGGMGRWARGKVAQGGKRAWRETGGKGAERLSEALANRTAGIPLVGTLGGFAARQIGRVGAASRGVDAERMTELEKKYKDRTPEEMEREIQTLNRSGLNHATVAKLVGIQAKKGETVELIPGNATANTQALEDIYYNRFVSGSDRKNMRSGNAALALKVLNSTNTRNNKLPQREQDDIAGQRTQYLRSLKSSGIENLDRSDINENLITEMIDQGTWKDNQFRAMYENAGSGFITSFNNAIQNIRDEAAIEIDNRLYPGGITPTTPTPTDAQATTHLATQGINMDINEWRRLVRYTQTRAATGLGLNEIPII